MSAHSPSSTAYQRQTSYRISLNCFNSSKKGSHHAAPGGDKAFFSTLEGLPHNKVHNYIGGTGSWDPGPYGYMTNNLSSIDPIFFLHHANMDRLWDVWTRKQMHSNQPILPKGEEWKAYSSEPFLFFVDSQGRHIIDGRAEDFVSVEKFGYSYAAGFGEELVAAKVLSSQSTSLSASVNANEASLALPTSLIDDSSSGRDAGQLAALITMPHPARLNATREFDVLVGGPTDIKRADPESPFYAGTISFFGGMPGMPGMEADSTFVVPLPRQSKALDALRNSAAALAKGDEKLSLTVPLRITIVPADGDRTHLPPLSAVRIQVR